MASASTDHHVPVLLQNDVGAVIEEQDRDGTQLGGCTARLGNGFRTHQVDQSLNDGVIGGVQIVVEREGAFALTVESSIAVWCYNPILHSNRYSQLSLAHNNALGPIKIITML